MPDQYDSEASLREADARLGLERVMEQYGLPIGQSKKFACPFCSHPTASSIFEMNGVKLFKCHNTGGSHAGACPTGNKPLDAVGFIAAKGGLTRKEAFESYLKQAGVWRDRAKYKAPSGGAPSQAPEGEQAPAQGMGLPVGTISTLKPEMDEDEELIQQCIEVIRHEQRASVSTLQRRLRLGYTRAARIMDELENRGFVGPAKGAEPRDILFALESGGGNLAVVHRDGEVSGSVPAAEVTGAPPEGESNPETIPSAHTAGADNATHAPSNIPGDAAPASPENPTVPSAAAGASHTDALREESKIVDLSGKPVVPDESEPDGWRSLNEFYSRLTFSEQDEAELFYKRGLESRTSFELGFKSNPKANREILIELEKKYGFDELRAAGLYLPEDRKQKKARRPNSQMCGLGITGTFRSGTKGQQDGTDHNDSAKEFSWGWVSPVIIPYFDEQGELIGLRPHKGMGRAGTLLGTPHVYVPRTFRSVAKVQSQEEQQLETEELLNQVGLADGQVARPTQERFHTAVVCEGEFKAAAIWQTIGAGSFRTGTGREDPIGVCALPGISFGKNYEIREELDDWLRRVKCRRVIVAFDSEEKSDPKLDSYKADPRKRYDSQKWAWYLATDLANKLHVRGEVCLLPLPWRNAKGKADWDGALAMLVHGAPTGG